MHIQGRDIPVKLEAPGAVARQTRGFGSVDAGVEMAGEYFTLAAGTDIEPLLKGLDHDDCAAAHWGFLVTGELVVSYRDGSEETCRSGDLFFWPPGHSVRVVADADVVLFSPAAEHEAVLDHMGGLLREMAG